MNHAVHRAKIAFVNIVLVTQHFFVTQQAYNNVRFIYKETNDKTHSNSRTTLMSVYIQCF